MCHHFSFLIQVVICQVVTVCVVIFDCFLDILAIMLGHFGPYLKFCFAFSFSQAFHFHRFGT